MSKQGEFMIFSAEQYKYAKKLTGRQLDELFSKYRVWDYLVRLLRGASHDRHKLYHSRHRSLYRCTKACDGLN